MARFSTLAPLYNRKSLIKDASILQMHIFYFDVDAIKAISGRHQCRNYTEAVRTLCAQPDDGTPRCPGTPGAPGTQRPEAVAVETEHVFLENNIAAFELDSKGRRIFDHVIDRRWDIVTDLRCDTFSGGVWTPLPIGALSILANGVVVASSACTLLPMCTLFSELRVRLRLQESSTPGSFRLRYTGHLLSIGVRELWIFREIVCDGLRYRDGTCEEIIL